MSVILLFYCHVILLIRILKEIVLKCCCIEITNYGHHQWRFICSFWLLTWYIQSPDFGIYFVFSFAHHIYILKNWFLFMFISRFFILYASLCSCSHVQISRKRNVLFILFLFRCLNTFAFSPWHIKSWLRSKLLLFEFSIFVIINFIIKFLIPYLIVTKRFLI